MLFGESQYLAIFETAYKALMRSIRDETGIIYGNVDMFTGAFATSWIDSLAAFFPGLQVCDLIYMHISVGQNTNNDRSWREILRMPRNCTDSIMLSGSSITRYPSALTF